MNDHYTNTGNPVDFPQTASSKIQKPYKIQVIESALEGLRQSGFPPEYARIFEIFFDRMYECGYNEAVRKLEDRRRYDE